MEKYAVIKLGTRQYVVHENDVFEVEKQDKPLKAEVLFYSDGSKSMVGEPVLKDVTVKMSVVEEKRGRKIIVGRFKAKSRYKKKRGHRQELTVIKVDKIHMVGEAEEKEEKATPVLKTVPPKTPKKEVKKVAAKKTSVKKPVVKKAGRKLPEKVKK